VTIVRRGYIDHTDSLGAAARYGNGDVQWLTAGSGVNHAEMFPLVEREKPNPLELFQIWLNLPRDGKFATPHFTMLWADDIPHHVETDEAGRHTEVTVIAGAIGDAKPLAPPPESWAAREHSDIAIWTISMEPGARFTLPPAERGSNRRIYLFNGGTMKVAGREIEQYHSVELVANASVELENGPQPSELLLLQGRPIGEPVVQHGPFVMNTPEEIRQTFIDYQQTQFGGWPWPSEYPVHPREEGRFAKHADGTVERP
jgi:quercetin 2,3-dioxygenase